MRKNQKGFSLIELLIVVAIILIIAAIAIPNLLRSKMAANEAAAVGAVRTVVTAQVTYSSTYNSGFAPTLAALSGVAGATATCTASELLDPTFNGPNPVEKQGYEITMAAANPPAALPPSLGCPADPDDQTFDVIAYPVTVGTTGQRAFCDDQTGAIMYDPTGTKNTVGGTSCALDGYTLAMGQ